MDKPSDIQAVGNELAAVLLQRLAQSHVDDPEGRSLSVRVARIEGNVESMLVTLRDLREDSRDFRKQTDERFEKIDERFEKIQGLMQENFKHQFDHIESVRREAKRDLYVLGSLMIALLGAMAKGFHWL